jgi:hypothetical protein
MKNGEPGGEKATQKRTAVNLRRNSESESQNEI